MNSTTKGSLAAVVAALLLTGGAGTLAYWNDTENVPAARSRRAQLDLLGTPACGAGWVLDGGATLTNQLIVPGDTLTKNVHDQPDPAGRAPRRRPHPSAPPLSAGRPTG